MFKTSAHRHWQMRMLTNRIYSYMWNDDVKSARENESEQKSDEQKIWVIYRNWFATDNSEKVLNMLILWNKYKNKKKVNFFEIWINSFYHKVKIFVTNLHWSVTCMDLKRERNRFEWLFFLLVKMHIAICVWKCEIVERHLGSTHIFPNQW